MGLAFDINALPEAPLNPHPELPGLYDYEGYIALKNCATVDEAVELLSGYNWGEAMWGQIHLADAKGDAVVISAGLDGELSFTRKEKGDGALVSQISTWHLLQKMRGRGCAGGTMRPLNCWRPVGMGA